MGVLWLFVAAGCAVVGLRCIFQVAVGHTATGVWLTGMCAAGHAVMVGSYNWWFTGGSRSYCYRYLGV